MAIKKRTRRRQPEPPVEISLVGELFEDEENEIVKALLDVPPGGEVIVYFDCSGGSVYAALSVATLLKLRKLTATAIVLGECSSAGILVFAACQKRLVTPRSVFLFHRVRWRSEKDVRSDEASNWSTHFSWLEKEVDRFQADLFDVDPKVFDSWINEGRFVLGGELVELGVAEMIEDVSEKKR